MDRRYAPTGLFAIAMMLGCSGAPAVEEEEGEEIASVSSELKKSCERDDDHECDCDGPSRKKAYHLTAFDATTGQLSGVNAFGRTFSAQVTAATKFKRANLNRFGPVDPIRPTIIEYNDLIAQGDQGYALDLLVGAGASVRVGIKNGLVRSLRPVPILLMRRGAAVGADGL